MILREDAILCPFAGKTVYLNIAIKDWSNRLGKKLSHLSHIPSRRLLAAGVFAFCAAWSYTVGRMLEYHGELLPLSLPGMAGFLLRFIAAFALTLILWRGAESLQSKPVPSSGPQGKTRILLCDALTFFFFLGSYLFTQLSLYPGMWTYDAWRVLARFQEHRMNSHIPIVYQLVMGSIVTYVAEWTGVNEKGVFAYIFLQVLLACFIFTFLLHEMRRFHIRRTFRVLTLLWLALAPNVSLFVVCSTKDSAFALFMMLALILLYQMVYEPDAFYHSVPRGLLLVLALLCMLLVRKNGLYALVATLPFLLLVVKKRLRTACLILLPAVLSVMIEHAVIERLSIRVSGRAEAISVPLQQIARTRLQHPDDLSAEDNAFLLSLQPQENWDSYLPKIADPVKGGIDADVLYHNLSYAIPLYLKQGLRHPVTYLEAWMLTSYGLWYPDAVMRTDSVTPPVEKTEYLWYPVDMPVTRRPVFDRGDTLYRTICEEQWVHEIPVLHNLLSPGFHTLFFLFAFLYLLQAGKKRTAAVLLLPGMILATVLIGPCSMTRYAFHLFLVFPLLITALTAKEIP